MMLQRRHRIILAMLALFFAPLLLSFAMYYGSSWRPSGRTNHGDLIDPARPLPAAAVTRVDQAGGAQSASTTQLLAGKWSLVYLGDGACDTQCRNTLYFIRQTHTGLGNLSSRVQRVFLATEHCCDLSFLRSEHPGLMVLDTPANDAAALLSDFPADKRSTSIFIVDPKGNLMMRYDALADPKGLREDLKKLLDLSSIG